MFSFHLYFNLLHPPYHPANWFGWKIVTNERGSWARGIPSKKTTPCGGGGGGGVKGKGGGREGKIDTHHEIEKQ